MSTIPVPKRSGTASIRTLNMLLYGESGTGKTTFACSAHGPLLLDLDGGVTSVRSLNVPYIPQESLRKWKDVLRVIDYALRDPKVATLIIDSFTMLSMLCLNYVLKQNSQSTPRIQDYGEQIRNLQGLVDRLTSQPDTSIVLVCHEEPVEDKVLGSLTYRPLVVGKFSSRISLFFDEVYRSVVRSKGLGKSAVEEYSLLTRKGKNFLAKSRLGLPKTLPNSPETWDLIYSPEKGGVASPKPNPKP